MRGARHPAAGRAPVVSVSSHIERILIVGAGIAGLALAIALRARAVGISIHIVERRSESIDDGAGLYLVGNAVRALGTLGLADGVMRRGAEIRSQRFLTDRGDRLFEIDTARYWSQCGPCVGVRRDDLQRALQERVGAAAVRFSTSVCRIDEQQRAVVVGFSDGTQDEYDFVVGCDGIRSSVRRLLFGEAQARYCGQIGWRCLVACPDPITAWTLMLGPLGAVLLVPVGAGQAYCYCDATAPRRLDDPREGRRERLQARFARFAQPVPDVLTQPVRDDQIHFAPIEEVCQQPWGSRRVLLIGDAAHAMSPNMACGAAMALEDAVVLGDLIDGARSVGDVIAEFTRRRSPRVQWVLQQSRRRDRLRRLPAGVRNLLLRTAGERIYRMNYAPLLESI